MPVRLKISASLTFVLAVLFYIFFQVSKHDPGLAHVNTFADDPYDAVGSFGVQAALFTALLSLIRAFRPYQLNNASDNQKLLLFRTVCLSCLSVAVTLVADVVAMIRYPFLWIGLPGGQMLASLLGTLALLTAFIGWFLLRVGSSWLRGPDGMKIGRSGWTRATLLSVVCILLLAFYPTQLRQSVPGELLTVCVGTFLLFVPLWALIIAISPLSMSTHFEDSIDDFTSVYRWVRAHAGYLAPLFFILEWVQRMPFIHTIVDRLNPRKYAWNLSILVGILMGALLILTEMIGEGGGGYQIGHVVTIATIFIVLEGSAVLLAYALLAKPLGLFRMEAVNRATPTNGISTFTS